MTTTDVDLAVGATNTRTASSSTTGATISYSSSNSSVASVNASTGEVTAVSEGSATITATASADGYLDATASYTVIVSDARTAVNLSTFTATNTTLIVGGSPSFTSTSVTNDQVGWTPAYTYSSSDTDVATVNASGVITAVAKGTATITCSLNVSGSDPDYKAGKTTSKTVDITVNNPSHTATFSVNGETTIDTFEEGAEIELPSDPSAIDGKVFRGWVESPIDGTTNSTPSFVDSPTMGKSDVTYYAVFADVVAGDEVAQSLTIDADENSTGFPTSYSASSDYTLSGKSFNITQVYDSGTKLQWRNSTHAAGAGIIYNNDELSKIQSIILTYDVSDTNYKISLKVGTSSNPTSGTSITPSSNNKVYTFDCSGDNYNYFVLTNGNSASYLSSIVINYKTGTPDSYANYCTTVVPTHTLTYSATNGTIAGEDENSVAVATGASVDEGATVTLTASPDEDYEFVSWSVEGEGSTLSSTTDNPTTFSMGTANATVTATFNYTRVANSINAIEDKEVGVLKSITLTPTSSNGTTPFTFSTTSDKISLSTASGTSCTVTGLDVTGETDAVVVIGQAAGTHNDVKYLAADDIDVNISVVDNRTTPSITFSSDEIDLTAGDDQTVTVTTAHTGTRSVTSSDDDIASVEMSEGNVYVLAGDKGGTATITLSIAENGDYKATSNTFTVNVDDGLSDPTITISSNEIGINAVKTFTLTSNSVGAITISTDDDHAVLEDKGNGTFSLTSDTEGIVAVNVSQDANGSYRAYETTFKISVVDNRSVPTFSFSVASKTVDWADRGDYVKPTLSNTSDATVTYTSSNTGVATVDSDGTITFVAGGTTTITASVSGSANYKDAQASYTLTVNKPFEFTETFNNATQSGTTYNDADNIGWTTSTAYAENAGVDDTKCARLASGSAGGSITTPALTELPTYSKMTFQAKSYGTDTGVSLSISGTNCTITSPSPASFNITNSYATYTVYITKTGDDPKITISAPTSKKRAYIDNVSITDLPAATISISDVELKEGATANASITTNNETGAFTFVSSDEDVATVAKIGDDYVVTGVAEGSATITATQDGNTYYKTTSTTFTVNVISATAVMNPTLSVASDETVEVGDNIIINAEEGCTIKYTTDNTDPTVSGTATSVETNTANVTVPTGVNSLTLKAVAKNGENFSEVVTATYNVVKKSLSASFAPEAIEVAIGGDADEPALTNPSGGTVIWTSDDTDVVTVNSEGQLTAIAAGTATITASIAATDTYQDGTATYEVTVFDPTNVGISFNNTFFEIDAITTWKAGDPTTATGTHRNISVTYAKGEGSYYYCSDSQIRCYSGNTLSFTAPSGYYLSSIEFTSSAWYTATPSTGSMNDDNTKLWEGSANTVSFNWSSTTRIESATVTLVEIESVTVGPVGYTTYVAKYDISFPEGVTAYIATATSSNTVTLTPKASVPEGTAIVIEASEGTYALPTIDTTPESVSGNLLQASDGSVTGDDANIFALGKKNGEVGFYLVADGVTVPAGKAYLNLTGSSVKEFLSFDFEDLPTGLNDVRSKMEDVSGEIFNLAGQKMNRLQKGINIVNGRKVFVK